MLSQIFFTSTSCLKLIEIVSRLKLGAGVIKKEKVPEKTLSNRRYFVGEAARRKNMRDGVDILRLHV